MVSRIVRSIPTLALVIVGGAWAQAFPTKPVTMIVPFSAGGPTDTVARTMGAAMQSALKQTVLVENVAGAGGTIGASAASRERSPTATRSSCTTSACRPCPPSTGSSRSTR